MKTYLVTTGTIFGLLVVAHIWRMFAEPGTRDPWYAAITLVAAALCFWAFRLLARRPAA
jgi:hypothetical protein